MARRELGRVVLGEERRALVVPVGRLEDAAAGATASAGFVVDRGQAEEARDEPGA
ncbi:hypothetical protein D3C83_175520 [compost metagenome]